MHVSCQKEKEEGERINKPLTSRPRMAMARASCTALTTCIHDTLQRTINAFFFICLILSFDTNGASKMYQRGCRVDIR